MNETTRVLVLNDGETYSDLDGCFVLEGVEQEVVDHLDGGGTYERIPTEEVVQVKIVRLRRAD